MTATLQAGSTGFPRAILQLGSRPGKLKEGAKEPHEGWVLSADSRQASAPSRPALPAPPPTKTPPAEETEGVGKSWSARPGSNRRPSAWKADALPTELLSLSKKLILVFDTRFCQYKSNFDVSNCTK